MNRAALAGALVMPAHAETPQRVALGGGLVGAFDPSIAAAEPGMRVWMAYSTVEPSARWPLENTRTEVTRLGYSDDRGATWKDAGLRLNAVSDVDMNGRHGSWVNEVPSLVYDRYAPATDRWQLYWHHYLSVGDRGEFAHGWIGYKGAPTPQALATAAETKLFSGRLYEAEDDAESVARSPLPVAPTLRLDRMTQATSFCLALTEPGGMATEAGVYLALGCVQPHRPSVAGMLVTPALGVRHYVVVLKCAAPCRPRDSGAWSFVGTPLTAEDADASGFKGFVAPDLYSDGSAAYLIASPMTDLPVRDAYNGCWVFRFADLGRALLARGDTDLASAVVHRAGGRPGTFNGACTYQPTVPASGFQYGEIAFETGVPVFMIYQTGPLR